MARACVVEVRLAMDDTLSATFRLAPEAAR